MHNEMLLKFKRRLIEERREILERIEFINEQAHGGLGMSLGESVGELSTYDNHPADIGSELFERSKDFSLRESAMINVVAIDDALKKIENGTYGACDVCGKEISHERLEAIPSTTKCRNCKDEEEKFPRKDERPVEEEVLGKPFARTFTDETESVIYDGEDAWQDVARYSETTDEWSRGGSYYGDSKFNTENRGSVEDVDNIAYEKGDDGMFYKDFSGMDDESAPE